VAHKYLQVPELVVGFDTETTGLSVYSDRAISYGFYACRFGVPVWSEHFYVVPDCPISPGAQRIHGIALEDLEEKRVGPVYGLDAGITRAVSILRDVHQRGAYVIGSNVVNFDLEMLRRSAISRLGTALNDEYLDLSLLRIIDVVQHDLAIEPSRENRSRRGLVQLCQHYGLAPGGHDALGDARAAVEVFCAQVQHNNSGQTSFLFPTNNDEYTWVASGSLSLGSGAKGRKGQW